MSPQTQVCHSFGFHQVLQQNAHVPWKGGAALSREGGRQYFHSNVCPWGRTFCLTQCGVYRRPKIQLQKSHPHNVLIAQVPLNQLLSNVTGCPEPLPPDTCDWALECRYRGGGSGEEDGRRVTGSTEGRARWVGRAALSWGGQADACSPCRAGQTTRGDAEAQRDGLWSTTQAPKGPVRRRCGSVPGSPAGHIYLRPLSAPAAARRQPRNLGKMPRGASWG